MAINTENINTGGARVSIGARTNLNVAENSHVSGLTSSTDLGATTGGVKITYTYETQDIFCDQHLAPIETAVISESATIEFEMLETDSENLRYIIDLYQSYDSSNAKLTSVGGQTSITYYALVLEIADNDNNDRDVTWTFFKVRSQGIETNYERENPTTAKVTFIAYADTSYSSGYQLFSIKEELIAP